MSKAVNRATSLRNLVKTALLAEGHIEKDTEGKISQAAIAELDKQGLIKSLAEMFANLERAGFLLLNATPVLHPLRKPEQEAGYWREFLNCLLAGLAGKSITLVLWGQIAKVVETLPTSQSFDKLVCEHPYNISFIDNVEMQQLFAEVRCLSIE